ncbi:Radical SAM superfamily protein [uncultured archaeon]|nr:Radical SAM superfamily protein [uncultured archaeon]
MGKELDFLAKRIGLEDISQSSYFPKYFEIETIRACNARCKMCTVYEWEGRNNRMEDKLFMKIADEMLPYNDWIERVCLSRNGEPLLDKNISERIRKLKNYGIKEVSFSTNASLLNEKKSVELIESGLDDIRFSIDGYTKETFEEIRTGLNFEEVRDNCLNFIKLRNERGNKPTVQIRMALQERNYSEEADWKKYWLQKVSEEDIVTSKKIHSWGNQLDSGELKTNESSNEPCVSLWSTMVVHFDGNVPLCGCDYNNKVLFGNIYDSTIQEVWQSKKFQDLREIHSSGKKNDISLCLGCSVWDREQKRIYKPGEE